MMQSGMESPLERPSLGLMAPVAEDSARRAIIKEDSSCNTSSRSPRSGSPWRSSRPSSPISLRIAIALVEICVGVAVAAVAAHFGCFGRLGSNQQWLQFLASTGAVLLTFLAGAELDPAVIRTKLTEVSVVGLVGFVAPFLGCAAVAHWLLGWDSQASLLAGVALSTTSMAVVYAVMLETGFNRTDFGKGILGACFINDLGR